jgi:type 1 glutamine amidotransferase
MITDNDVLVSWQGQNGHWWNESCAMVLEVFGLPGGRFVSHPTTDHIKFTFNSKKDADLCRILLSERL